MALGLALTHTIERKDLRILDLDLTGTSTLCLLEASTVDKVHEKLRERKWAHWGATAATATPVKAEMVS